MVKKNKTIIDRIVNNLSYYAGYPVNTDFNYENLFELLRYPINNLGDPFLLKNPFSSHEYEIEVIKWFLKLYGFTDDSGWGYVTSGGTEGILFGIWQGKENLTNPILYFSKYAHYSVLKCASITGIEYRIINTNDKGEMDYGDFNTKLVANRDAIVLATIGNTITSAIDNVANIKNITSKNNIKTYIHADAAFDGMILPFIETKVPYKLSSGINSLSISGHKIIGSPVPCGIAIIHRKHITKSRRAIDYVTNTDCTINSSRSGFSALILWSAIKENNKSGYETFIKNCREKAKIMTQKLNDRGIFAWRFDHAITIVLNKLPKALTIKWRMPSNDKYTTLTALPKLTENMLEHLINDIKHFEKHQSLPTESGGIEFPKNLQDISLEIK